MNADIVINGVSKKFNEIVAVKNVSLEVEKGELFGLIGPDGAGKTTLFRLMCTLYLPDEGTISLGGADTAKDYDKIRSSVVYMPGRF